MDDPYKVVTSTMADASALPYLHAFKGDHDPIDGHEPLTPSRFH
jgi:hypothetical protein